MGNRPDAQRRLRDVDLYGGPFTSTFAQARDKSRTLGANVIGAVAGGLSQNASFIFGLKALLPMAALCYVGAALFGKEKSA